MASSVPTSVALTTIADGANIVASDHRNNYLALQTAVNGLITLLDEADAKGDLLIASGADAYDNLAVGGNGKVLVADSTQTLGMKWDYPPGYALDRATAVTSDANITGTTSGSPTTVITGNAVTYDGTAVWIRFSCYALQRGTGTIHVGVYKDGSLLNEVGLQTVSGIVPGGTLRLRDTPAAGSHTYSVRAWVDAGTGVVYASAAAPIELTVEKA